MAERTIEGVRAAMRELADHVEVTSAVGGVGITGLDLRDCPSTLRVGTQR